MTDWNIKGREMRLLLERDGLLPRDPTVEELCETRLMERMGVDLQGLRVHERWVAMEAAWRGFLDAT